MPWKLVVRLSLVSAVLASTLVVAWFSPGRSEAQTLEEHSICPPGSLLGCYTCAELPSPTNAGCQQTIPPGWRGAMCTYHLNPCSTCEEQQLDCGANRDCFAPFMYWGECTTLTICRS